MKDVRTRHHDIANLNAELRRRLNGQACACCGATDELQDDGHAYLVDPVSEQRLGYRVRVCPRCPRNITADEGSTL